MGDECDTWGLRAWENSHCLALLASWRLVSEHAWMAYPGKSPRADKVSVGVKTEAPDFLEFGRSMAIGRERGDLRAGDSEPSVRDYQRVYM